MERIGGRVIYRYGLNYFGGANGGLSTIPSIGPVMVDCSIRDDLGRFAGTQIQGWATGVANRFDFDADGIPDKSDGNLVFNERWVIDGDPEDDIQSIHDVLPGADSDGDGLTDVQEFNRTPKTNPAKADTDGDGMPDGWEVLHGLNPSNPADGILDADGDGLSNLQEYQLGTKPNDDDTDGDGLTDGWEVLYGLNPLSPPGAGDAGLDPDNDGLTNAQELAAGTNPQDPDTDGDGLEDGAEVLDHLTNPLEPDSDFDGLSDHFEVHDTLGFTPNNPDSDGDGVRDGDEWAVIQHALANGRPEVTQALVEPDDDYDDDNVLNVHESEDRTSLVDPDDYFSPVIFDRLFGRSERVTVTEDTLAGGVKATRLVRNAPLPSETAGMPAGGVSHHEAKEGTRVRFQFLPFNSAVPAGVDQVVIGFSARSGSASIPGAVADLPVAIRRVGESSAELRYYGTPAGEGPFVVSSTDLLELRIEANRIHLFRNYELVDGFPVDLPAGINFATDPHALVVALNTPGVGIHNLRYRRIHDPDWDNDFMADAWELAHGLDPNNPADADTDIDRDTNNVIVGDGLTNREEYEVGTDPNNPDTDGDGMPDGWEHSHGRGRVPALAPPVGLNPLDPGDAGLDPDGDKLTNLQEFNALTDPHNVDTDGDGLWDGWEVLHGFNPRSLAGDLSDATSDSDADGVSNLAEFNRRSPIAGDPYRFAGNPWTAFTASDGFHDAWKDRYNISPGIILDNGSLVSPSTDPDNDGLTNAQEHQLDTNPYHPDTDGDGMPDGWEHAHGAAYTPPAGSGVVYDPADGLDPLDLTDATDDADDDGFNNLAEYQAGSDPHDPASTPHTIDTDGDGMPDFWEVEYGLDPGNPADAASDWDYDGLTALQEYQHFAATGVVLDPRPKWREVEIPNGLPAWSPSLVADPTLASPLIGGFNALGQIVRIENEGGELWMRRFDPALVGPAFDGWSEEADSIGEVAGPASWHLQEVRQNLFGLVAASFKTNIAGAARMHLRILDVNRRAHRFGLDPEWKSISGLRVTDSGYVVAFVEASDTSKYLLRWRRGVMETFPLSAADHLLGVSERGEALVKNLGVLIPGSSTWVATPATTVAIRPYGEIEHMWDLAPYGDLLNHQGPYAPPFFYRTNSSGDLIASSLQPRSLNGLNVEPLEHGVPTAFVWNAEERALYLDGTNLIESNPASPPGWGDPSNLPVWTTFGSDVNRRGDFVGSHIAELSYHQLDNSSPGDSIPLVACGNGYLLQRGKSEFALENPFTRYWRIGDAGHILASSAHMEPNFEPDSTVTNLTYTLVIRWFFVLPDNDIDRNGLPDDWELFHFGVAGGTKPYRDDDGDGLDNRREFLIGTDPNASASHLDGIDDGWKAQEGLDPREDATGSNFDLDGDTLSWIDEFNGGWDPHSPDSDGDGLPDNDDEVDDRPSQHFNEPGLRISIIASEDTVYKNGFKSDHNGARKIYQTRTSNLESEGNVTGSTTLEDGETVRKKVLEWSSLASAHSNYPKRLTLLAEGEQAPTHQRNAHTAATTEIEDDNDISKSTIRENFTGEVADYQSGSLHTSINGSISSVSTYLTKSTGESTTYSETRNGVERVGELESHILTPGATEVGRTPETTTETTVKELSVGHWSGEAAETYTKTYTQLISDLELSQFAYNHKATGPESRTTVDPLSLPHDFTTALGFSMDEARSSVAARYVVFDRASDTSDTESAYVTDGSYSFEVKNPTGEVLVWWEAYRIVADNGSEIATGVIQRHWIMNSKYSRVFRLGKGAEGLPDTGNVQAHYLSGSMSVLSGELRDVKGDAVHDDVTIQDWDGNNPISPPSIAWIEPHLAANEAPQMPQLEFRIPNLPNNIKVKAKLEVRYDRAYFAQAANKSDKVEFAAEGEFSGQDGRSWQIWREYKDEPFFGGEATLTYKIGGGDEQAIKFRIGGKNPDDQKCKAYIETVEDAGHQGSLWFSYAIAKHESKGYNEGVDGVYYNQFMALPRHPNDNGFPLHVRAEPSGAGGVGIIQVTGKGGDKNLDADRQIFWNWQENLNQGVSIVRSKKTIVDEFWPRQFNSNNANGVALPPITVAGVLFEEGSNKRMYHLLIMKAYNGAGRVNPHHNSEAVTGFTLDTTLSGHFSYWHNDRSSWGLNQFARFDPNKPPNNYASKVCHELD